MAIGVRILLLMLVAVSCQKYSQIGLQQTTNHSDALRIGGYFFLKDSYNHSDRMHDSVTSVLIFYRDGLFTTRSFLSLELGAIDSMLERQRGPLRFLEGTGYYSVSGKNITMEYWTNASYFPIPTATAAGVILNDSTLKSSILGHYENDVWRFRPLAIKPDSTTLFDEQLEKGEPIRRTRRGSSIKR